MRQWHHCQDFRIGVSPCQWSGVVRIEQAIKAAVDQEDYGPFEKLLKVLSSPYEQLDGLREYMLPPKPEEHVLQTFCGT